MSNKIFSKYLGVGRFEKDVRKKNLIDDNINPKRWEYNVVYLGRNLHRSAGMHSEEEGLIVDRAETTFKEICFNLGHALGDYPLALNIYEMYWYIAAYPDVVNFFYPSLDMSIEENKQIAELEKRVSVINKILDEFEETIVVDGMDTTEYYLALKDFYKKNNRLLMASS